MPQFRITLRHRDTGESRAIVEEYESMDVALRLWQQGNYSCDCNRALFYSGWDHDLPCNEDGHNVIELVSVGAVNVLTS